MYASNLIKVKTKTAFIIVWFNAKEEHHNSGRRAKIHVSTQLKGYSANTIPDKTLVRALASKWI